MLFVFFLAGSMEIGASGILFLLVGEDEIPFRKKEQQISSNR
jgi:hypothetical protein